jgi:hypothetical protein
MPDVERRESPRTRAVLAVGIDGQVRKHRFGISRDTSATGMLLATPSRFEVGEELALTVFLGVHEQRSVRGRVIRVETNPLKSSEPWRYRLALAYAEPSPELQERCASALDAA